MPKRIVYIDALRGLAIFLVVSVHIEGFSLYVEEFHISFFRRLCEAIMMPLFFFISGYVANIPSCKSLIENSLRLIIPALILGIIYSISINKGIYSFITNIYKYGYWFTITLCWMYSILFCIGKLIKKSEIQFVGLILISVLLYFIKIPFNNVQNLMEIGNTLCLHQLFIYFHYFSIGYIFAKSNNRFYTVFCSEFGIIFSLFVFACAIYIKHVYTDEQLATSILLKIYRAIQDPILGYSGIMILFRFFKSMEIFFVNLFLGKTLCYVGKHTLEIYLLHYFFLPKLPMIGSYLVYYPNIILELLVCMLLSVSLICISLVVGWFIRSNEILGVFLLGCKPLRNNVKREVIE